MPLRRRVHTGDLLTNVAKTLITFGNNLTEGGAIARNISINNLDGSRHHVTIHFVPSGQIPSETYCIYEDYVPANSPVIIEGPWFRDSGAYLSAISDAATTHVVVQVTAAEEYIVS